LPNKRNGATQQETIELKWGKLRLRRLAFALAEKAAPTNIRLSADGVDLNCKHRVENDRIVIDLAAETVLQAGHKIEIAIS